MPDSVDMPAPVKVMACLLSAKSLAARLIKSSTTIYLKIAIIAAKIQLICPTPPEHSSQESCFSDG
jgi:hypothetical protein